MKKRIEYLKENFDKINLEVLKKELLETKDKELKEALESLISIKEAEGVDLEFTSGIKHGGARKGAGRATEEKRTVAYQLKTTPKRRDDLKEKVNKLTKFYGYSGGDLVLLELLEKEIKKNNL